MLGTLPFSDRIIYSFNVVTPQVFIRAKVSFLQEPLVSCCLLRDTAVNTRRIPPQPPSLRPLDQKEEHTDQTSTIEQTKKER